MCSPVNQRAGNRGAALPHQRIRAIGDDLLSIGCDSSDAAQRLASHLRAVGGWLEAVAGMDSVVVQFDAARIDPAAATERLADMLEDVPAGDGAQALRIDIPVHYDGADLDAVCAQLALTREAFIELHTRRDLAVEMLGFTPGFAYVDGPGEFTAVRRLDQPRQSVAAGSIGIAGGRTGIYALAGPGGWPIIGHTVLPLFDLAADDPFLLSPGVRVRFKRATEAAS